MISARYSLSLLAFPAFLSLSLAAPAGRVLLASSDLLANGQDAQNLNVQFATLNEDDPCTDGAVGCIGQKFAQCAGDTWFPTNCSAGTQCFALPLVNSRGTSVACTTEGDALTRIQATGATGGITGGVSTGSNSTSSVSEPTNVSATITGSASSPSITATEEESITATSGTETALSSTSASSGADVDDPNGKGDDGEACSVVSSGELGVTGSVDETGAVFTATSASDATATTSLGEPSASVTVSATDSNSDSFVSLLKRQDGITDIQSTLIPLTAVGSADIIPGTGTFSASEPLATSTTSTGIIGTVSAAQDTNSSGVGGENTVTVTVTITAIAVITAENPLSTEPAPAAASGVLQSDTLGTAIPTNSVVITPASDSLLLGTVSDPGASGLPTDSLSASPALVSQDPALPTDFSTLTDPLATSNTTVNGSTTPVFPSVINTAVLSGSAIVSEIGEAIPSLPATLSSSATEVTLTTTPAPEQETETTTPSSQSPLFASSDIAFLLTATI